MSRIDDIEYIEKNGKKFYKVMSEGKTYRAWSKDGQGKPIKAFEQLKAGEFKKDDNAGLKFTENKVGEYTYKNLTEIVKGSNTPSVPNKPTNTFAQRDNYWSDKLAFDKSNSERIGRQACINSANEYYKVSSHISGEEMEIQKLLEIALIFEKFAKSGVIK